MTTITRIRQTAVAIAMICLIALSFTPAFAQNAPPTWVYARDYNYRAVIGQTASTYTFNSGACNYTPASGSVNGVASSIFDFSGSQGATLVYFPVFILDANAALNEIVTPTSTTNTQSSCGFAATTANSHTSFQLQSGTAGLQEAITNQLQVTPVFDVVLDKYWYQLVAGFPSTTTPQSIIKALTGSANVGIVDTTTSPWTFYSWNGVNYVAASSTGGIPFTSLTPIAAPVALTTVAATCLTNGGGCITTSTTGGSIPASGAYTLGATYVTALGGETTLSIDTAGGATETVGSTATNTITVTSPAAETGAVGWRVYMSAASGGTLSEILYVSSCASASTGQIVLNGVCAIGSSATITAIVTGTATIPTVSGAFPVASGSTSPAGAIGSYPPFTALGTVATTVVGNLGLINLPAGFLNSLGRTLQICGTGYGTTNGTGGTLTFATKLASVPGVTAVTPFTVASAAIAASVITVNFTFCETWTTSVVGSSGKIEAHGVVNYNLAGTAVSSPAQDFVITASAAVDLTKQDQLEFTLTPTTAGITAGQLRQLTVQVLQ